MHFAITVLWWLSLEVVFSSILAENRNRIRERLHAIQDDLFRQVPTSKEIDDLEDSAISHLRHRFRSSLLANWNIDASVLDELPLAILTQLSPASPLSLVGCPQGTVPFDLNTCTPGIIAEEDIAGTCVGSNTIFSRHLQSCSTRAEAEPYTLCPDGFRITLPPVDTIKGPCQSQEVIPAIPTCDAPYKLLEAEGICIKSWATTGYIGCRPGEIRKGKTCYLALQFPVEVECISGFEGHLTADGVAECIRTVVTQGRWSTWSHRPICPPSSKPVVEFHPYSTSLSHLDHSTNNPNVTCIETEIQNPQRINCPTGSIRYDTFVSHYYNFPPVQYNSALGHPRATCVKVKEFPVGPACPKVDQKVFINGTELILEEVLRIQSARRKQRDRWREKIEQTLQLNGRTDHRQPGEELQSTQADQQVSLRQLRKQSKINRKNIEYKKRVMVDGAMSKAPFPIFPSSQDSHDFFQLEDSSEEELNDREIHSHHRRAMPKQTSQSISIPLLDIILQTETFPELSSQEISSVSSAIPEAAISFFNTSKINLEKAVDDELLESHATPYSVEVPIPDVDWNSAISVDTLMLDLGTKYNITASDIDWIALVGNESVRVICEATSTAQFYFTCPEKFRLRKDGTCKGYGYTHFLVLCPEGFALDQLHLTSSRYRFPKARCVGQIPTLTNYYCPLFEEHISENPQFKAIGGNTSSVTLEESDQNISYSLDHYDEELLILQFLTDAFINGKPEEIGRGATGKNNSFLANVFDQIEYVAAHGNQITPWSMFKDFPSLDHLILAEIGHLGPLSFSPSASNGDDDGIFRRFPHLYQPLLPPNSTSIKQLDRSFLHMLLTSMPPISTLNHINQPTNIENVHPRAKYPSLLPNVTKEIIKDEDTKRCYVVQRIPVFFTPTQQMILTLYGNTFGGEFLSRIARGEAVGGSPFYPILPKLTRNIIKQGNTSMTREELNAYTRRQQVPQFGPPPSDAFKKTGIPIPYGEQSITAT